MMLVDVDSDRLCFVVALGYAVVDDDASKYVSFNDEVFDYVLVFYHL